MYKEQLMLANLKVKSDMSIIYTYGPQNVIFPQYLYTFQV